MRILGLDYGSKTVGVAVTDPLGLTAQGVEIIRRKEENKLRRTYARIEELAKEYGATAIVLGYPLNMDDTEGERTRKTLAFKEALERRTGLPIFLQDERLTTVEADEIMIEAGLSREERKQHVDRIAAQLILRDWLSERKAERNEDIIENGF